jgi:hypothetical protein
MSPTPQLPTISTHGVDHEARTTLEASEAIVHEAPPSRTNGTKANPNATATMMN